MKKLLLIAAVAVLAGCSAQRNAVTVEAGKFPELNQNGKTAVVAHRGFWKCDAGGDSQNSIASLGAAIDNGFWGSECDIHLTSDDVIIVNHDNNIDGLPIRNHTYAELSAHLLPNGEKRPTFDEYLDRVAASSGRTVLVVEFKTQGSREKEDLLVGKTLDALKAHNLFNPSRVAFISFGHSICRTIAARAPEFVNQYLNGDIAPAVLAKEGINGIDYEYRVFHTHPEWVKEAHELGMSVNAWTVDKPAEMDYLAGLGVDAITSNVPLIVRERLGDREFRKAGPSFSVSMTGTYCRDHGLRSPQGAAVFGDLLFQFHDHNPAVAVYDLNTGTLAGDIVFGAVPTYHCNNVQFSTLYYARGDEFPLLYVSMENASEHCALAYRITRDGKGGFAAENVQKIVFPAPEEMGVYYPNIILDLQAGNLFVGGYAGPSWNRPDGGNAVRLLKFAMPSPDRAVVQLRPEDILEKMSTDFRVATQGASIRNGKLYQVFGVPGMGPTSLCCFDLSGFNLEWSFDLPSCGIAEEPEALGFHRDELIVVGVSGKVYRSGMNIPWTLPAELSVTAPRFAAGARKKLICMDLDATLTQHRTPLEQFNREALDNLGKKFDLVMVCAGNAPRVWKQMGEYPIDILGNYGMQEARVEDGELRIVRQITVPADTAFFLAKTDYLRKKYGYTEYGGDPVEFHAAGMVTFGLLGTDVPGERKLLFDPDRAKRRAMYPEVLEIFKDYAVFIGGSTSFDFAPKQFNKYDATLEYARERGYTLEDVIFIGDDFDDGGGDSHVRIKGMDYISIDDYHNFRQKTNPLLLQ